ncbi:MAG: aspartate--tRNA(Asn) ligase [Firmicutes bacterium]|nr:aspartate--tRNA(Asn) ligase [Bacillota bacterium]
MERTLAKEARQKTGRRVRLCGWVHRLRDLGNLTFLMLRDRSGLIQVVLEGKDHPELRQETVVQVEGKVVASDKAPDGVEIQAAKVEVLSAVEYDYLPLAVNSGVIKEGLDTILNHRVLSLRNPLVHGIFLVQQEIVRAFREFFRNRGFTEIHTPKIVAEGAEGGAEMFPVKYFKRRAYLAQSPQFYKQMMVAAGYERVFEVGHAYRAELHNTKRHLNEYISLDVEMGFIQDEHDLMAIENEFLRYLFTVLPERCGEEFAKYGVELTDPGAIPELTVGEAQALLKKEYGKSLAGGNIDAEAEKLLGRYIKAKTGSDFLFLTAFPVAKRPVYAMPMADEPALTKSFDLLYKGLEITTGGQRIHSHRMLYEKMVAFGLNPEDFGFYLDTFKYGVPPHGGFAIGCERLTMQLLNLANIREASLFPRDMERVTP